MNMHRMTLDGKFFEKIASGEKTVELRLCDEKRRGLRVGDVIRFDMRGTDFYLETEVVGIVRAPSFASLLTDAELLSRALPKCTYDEAICILREFYTEEDEARWGVVGIEIKLG